MICGEEGGGRSGLSRDQKHRWRLFVCLPGSVFIIKASLPSHWWGSFLDLYWVNRYKCIYMCAHACTIRLHMHIYLTFVLFFFDRIVFSYSGLDVFCSFSQIPQCWVFGLQMYVSSDSNPGLVQMFPLGLSGSLESFWAHKQSITPRSLIKYAPESTGRFLSRWPHWKKPRNNNVITNESRDFQLTIHVEVRLEVPITLLEYFHDGCVFGDVLCYLHRHITENSCCWFAN